ncbi:MAG TPA: alcohol dehydrogenase catalytic domain-containing protein [Actinomycetales bacterium]|nr:alcohol dehydrogenase catalytic domain-containing protein [Actinomycetales bacterium]
MKANIYRGVKDIEFTELPMPEYGPKDALIRVTRAGICGTDLHAYLEDGEAVGIPPGNQFGHEFVGVVEAVGDEVTDVKAGDRVWVNPTHRLPPDSGVSPIEIADSAGGFSEYMVVEQVSMGKHVHALPDNLHFDKAVIIEPMSVAMGGCNTSGAKPGDKVLIYGAGPVGLGVVAGFISKGITDIIISDVVPLRLEAAEKMGAIAHNAKESDVLDFVKEKWGTGTDSFGKESIMADHVIDCAGFKGVLEQYMANGKVKSRFTAVALAYAPEEVVPYTLVVNGFSILGSLAYTADDVEEVIAMLAENKANVDPIVTAAFPTDQLAEAFEAATDRDGQIKVTINHEM